MIAMAQQRLWLGLLALVLLSSELTESHHILNVGGGFGWNFDANTWAQAQVFHQTDVLVFKYDAAVHNVVMVNKYGYEHCQPNENSEVRNSGDDRIELHHKGKTYYFICSVTGHCNTGMKMEVKVV